MRPIITILTGSHLYGTAMAESDHDYKVVYIPSDRAILLGDHADREESAKARNAIGESLAELNNGEKIDVEFLSLDKFVKLLCQGQTNAMDMLFAPESFYVGSPSAEWYAFIANREKFLSRNCKSFVGYCRSQVSKYVVKQGRYEAVRKAVNYLTKIEGTHLSDATHLKDFVAAMPMCSIVEIHNHVTGSTVEHLDVCETRVPLTATVKEAVRVYQLKLDNYGERVKKNAATSDKDWKSMYHAVRVAKEAIELLEEGSLTFPRPEADLLLNIRCGEISFELVQEMIEEGLKLVEEAVEQSSLPEKPDTEFAESLVENYYRSEVLCSE